MTDTMAYRWDGESMVPVRPKQADAAFVVGDVYWLAEKADTSGKTMAHEFCWLKDAWLSLPEQVSHNFASPEHLRKRALIDSGYYDEQIVDAGSNSAAIRVAAAMRSIDDFALVFVRGIFVIRRTAKSQSRRAMKGDEFHRSKQAIMEVIAGLLGIAPDELERHGGKAA